MFIPKTIVEMRKHHDDIVVPSYKKKAGHPVLISNEMIPDILAYDGENGLRGAIEKYADRRVFVEVDDIGVLSLNQEDDELQSQIEEHNKSILHPILTFGIGHETPFFNARLKLLLFLIEDLNNVRTVSYTHLDVYKRQKLLSEQFDGKLRISYSGGATIYNIREMFDAGIWPITMATNILKPGGYERLSQISEKFMECGTERFHGTDTKAIAALDDAVASDELYKKPVKPLPERHMEKELPLFDCFTAPCRNGCPIAQDIPCLLYTSIR